MTQRDRHSHRHPAYSSYHVLIIEALRKNRMAFSGQWLHSLRTRQERRNTSYIHRHMVYKLNLWVPNQDAHSLWTILGDLLVRRIPNNLIPAPARRVFYGAVKLGPLYGSKSTEHYSILRLILIKCFSIAKLVRITTRTGSIVCIFEDANFSCDKKGLWQSTLKLITLCLHKWLNSDKCLKEQDYISRPYPSSGKEWKFS